MLSCHESSRVRSHPKNPPTNSSPIFPSHSLNHQPSLHPPHQPPPNLRINHPTHPKSRHNPTYPRRRTLRPIPQDLRAPTIHAPHTRPRPIIQIQPQQMQRRRHQLHSRRGNELRCTSTAHIPPYALTHMCFEARREERREVEGREDGEAVADCEKCESGQGNGAYGARGAEELCEFVVFVETQGEVGGGSGKELWGSCCCG